MERLEVKTEHRSQMVDVTTKVAAVVARSGVKTGQVTVYVPHTTASVTINEHADPDVAHDILAQLDRMVPWEQPFYKHAEGNSAAHVKASMMGSSVTVFLNAGKPLLGRWQGIFLCEFDGPRTREMWVRVTGE